MSEVNKAVMRRVIEEGLNKRNFSLINDTYLDCVYRSPVTGEIRGEALKQFIKSVLVAFPDARYAVEDQVDDGDKVFTRWSFTGTHKGELMGIAPAGKRVRISGMVIDRIVDGKIIEEWEEWDALGMMQQLGVVATFPKVERKIAA
jgi:steroid delta-isomerase-like uncharacterized protein